MRLVRVCWLSLQPIGCTSPLACDVQRCCICSCWLWRCISVMPFTTFFHVFWKKAGSERFKVRTFQDACSVFGPLLGSSVSHMWHVPFNIHCVKENSTVSYRCSPNGLHVWMACKSNTSWYSYTYRYGYWWFPPMLKLEKIFVYTLKSLLFHFSHFFCFTHYFGDTAVVFAFAEEFLLHPLRVIIIIITPCIILIKYQASLLSYCTG